LSDSYKTAKDLGLPQPLGECWTCGFSLLPHQAKCYGVAEEPDGTFVPVCAVCFQVMTIMNRELLHEGDWLGEKPMGGPYIKMYLVGLDGRVAIWKVLDHEPWLEQIQKRKEVEA
jgi:hypothetical protein